MPAFRIEAYVIVSADGRLADERHVMPEALKFEGDKRFFTAALDRADLIVHGRHSNEDQPNSLLRKRIILTRRIGAIAPDPSNPKALLWNPAGATFEAACEQAGAHDTPCAVAVEQGVCHTRLDSASSLGHGRQRTAGRSRAARKCLSAVPGTASANLTAGTPDRLGGLTLMERNRTHTGAL